MVVLKRIASTGTAHYSRVLTGTKSPRLTRCLKYQGVVGTASNLGCELYVLLSLSYFKDFLLPGHPSFPSDPFMLHRPLQCDQLHLWLQSSTGFARLAYRFTTKTCSVFPVGISWHKEFLAIAPRITEVSPWVFVLAFLVLPCIKRLMWLPRSCMLEQQCWAEAFSLKQVEWVWVWCGLPPSIHSLAGHNGRDKNCAICGLLYMVYSHDITTWTFIQCVHCACPDLGISDFMIQQSTTFVESTLVVLWITQHYRYCCYCWITSISGIRHWQYYQIFSMSALVDVSRSWRIEYSQHFRGTRILAFNTGATIKYPVCQRWLRSVVIGVMSTYSAFGTLGYRQYCKTLGNFSGRDWRHGSALTSNRERCKYVWYCTFSTFGIFQTNIRSAGRRSCYSWLPLCSFGFQGFRHWCTPGDKRPLRHLREGHRLCDRSRELSVEFCARVSTMFLYPVGLELDVLYFRHKPLLVSQATAWTCSLII